MTTNARTAPRLDLGAFVPGDAEVEVAGTLYVVPGSALNAERVLGLQRCDALANLTRARHSDRSFDCPDHPGWARVN